MQGSKESKPDSHLLSLVHCQAGAGHPKLDEKYHEEYDHVLRESRVKEEHKSYHSTTQSNGELDVAVYSRPISLIMLTISETIYQSRAMKILATAFPVLPRSPNLQVHSGTEQSSRASRIRRRA